MYLRVLQRRGHELEGGGTQEKLEPEGEGGRNDINIGHIYEILWKKKQIWKMEAQTDYSTPKRGSLVNAVTGHLWPVLLFEDGDMTWCCNRAPSRKKKKTHLPRGLPPFSDFPTLSAFWFLWVLQSCHEMISLATTCHTFHGLAFYNAFFVVVVFKSHCLIL